MILAGTITDARTFRNVIPKRSKKRDVRSRRDRLNPPAKIRSENPKEDETYRNDDNDCDYAHDEPKILIGILSQQIHGAVPSRTRQQLAS